LSYVYVEARPNYEEGEHTEQENRAHAELEAKNPLKGVRINVDFIGANSSPIVTQELPNPGYFNYYYPHCANGITNVKAFNKLTYHEVYKSTDIVFYGGVSSGLKYDIVVNPGGELNKIKFKYSGAEALRVENGRLALTTGLGLLEERIPKIYQTINGQEIVIEGGYVIKNNQVGFEVKNYNKSVPLIIDPWWSTYYGGNTDDIGYGDAIDNSGNVIAVGITQSTDLPVAAGMFQTTNKGAIDGSIVKFDKNGSFLWATYYGGTNEDDAMAVTTDGSDNIDIVGYTISTNFPVSAGAFQSTNKATGGIFGINAYNAFIIKLNSAGVRQWATYYGGDGIVQGWAIATDANNNVAITGQTTSSTGFPISAGAFQPTKAGTAGENDAFAAEFDPNGNNLWSTYVGGSTPGNQNDRGYGIAIDKSNNVFITGWTECTDFPTTATAFQPTLKGTGAAFVFKFTPLGARSWATYFGGTGSDAGHGIAIDNNDNVIFAGSTSSSDLPVTPGVYQTTYTMGAGSNASFVAKFTNNGSEIWATYNNIPVEWTYAMALAVDQDGYSYIVDDLESLNSGGPSFQTSPTCVFDAAFNSTPDATHGNPEDQYIAKFTPTGTMACFTYVGGDRADEHEAFSKTIAVKGCRMVLTGRTGGGSFPTSAGAYQTSTTSTISSGSTFFITNLNTYACGVKDPSLSFSSNVVTGTSCGGGGAIASFKSTVCDTLDTAGVSYQWYFPGATPSSGTGRNISGVTYNTSGFKNITLTMKLCSGDTFSSTTAITVPSGGSGPTLTAAVASPKCVGSADGTATITTSGGTANYTYSWSSGSSTVTSALSNTITGLTAKTYTVTITDSGGCVSSTTVIVTPPPALSATSGSTPADCGVNDGTASVTASGGAGGFSYSWSGGPATQTYSSVSANTYTVIVTDANGCTISTTAIVGNLGGETLSLSSQSNVSCNGGSDGSATIAATGGTPGYTYSWSNNATTAAASGLTQGIYSVTVTDANNCKSVSSVTITEPSVLSITPSSTPNACGTNNGSVSAAATGGTSAYTYSWNNTATTATVSGVGGGTYTVTVTDAKNCSQTATVTVNTTGVTANAGKDTTVCAGKSVQLNGTGGGTYSWSPSASLDNATIANPTATPASTTMYTLTTTSGTCTGTDSVLVTVNKASGISAGPDENITTGQSINLSGAGAVIYRWSTLMHLNDSTIASPLFGPASAGVYKYILYGSDANGCLATDTVIVTVTELDCKEGDAIFIPTAFSPNGDGQNDVLRLHPSNCVKAIQFVLYNRWGQKVFETTNALNYWDGKLNGVECDSGVYAYYMSIDLQNGVSVTKKGNVTLLK